jgi:pimeloyl-ACP methyl ester carboxylesterase
LHYIQGQPEQGASRATPLILLHQNPSSSREYDRLIAELGRDRTVIAFDTPGNGMSDRPPNPITIAEYASAFAEGIEAMGYGAKGAGKVDVFGFHSGTYYVSELAASRPDLVRRVVLSGIPFRPHDERQTRLEAARNAPGLTEEGDTVFAKLKWLWNFQVTDRDKRVPLERAAELFMEMSKPLHRSDWPYQAVWSYPAEERLPEITQPTLVLAPNDVTFANTKRAAAIIPGSKLVLFEDMIHNVFEVGIDRYAAEMRDFLDRP